LELESRGYDWVTAEIITEKITDKITEVKA